MVIKRKVRKLFRDPKLFFSDMLIKHRKKLDKLKPIKKYDGQNQFTVVSAVYCVEKYLDDYFKSLVNQRLDFEKHIHLIMVDDGSLDNSAEIIKKWQKKYPDNITYLYKENGGQASARNLGLEYVKTKWVTFIDPDDFVDKNYFYSINKFLETSNDKYAFIGCNLLFYFEDIDQYKDTHPLSYKFKEKVPKVYSCSDLKKNIHMSSSSAIFSMEVIRQGSLHFDEKIKPSFEDASFISYYLFFAGERYKATFLSDPIYFYRKRSDNSSTLDTAWINPKKYKDAFIYGYLPLLEFYHREVGNVPLHIQRQVLYDLVWYFKYLLNENEKLSFLSDQEIESFYSYYEKAFSYIDGKTIFDFELAKIWFYHKVLLVLTFKSDYEFLQQFYIERYNPIRKELRVSFFADKNADIQILIDGKDIIPLSGKVMPQYFAKKEVGAIHSYYISIVECSNDSKLRVLLNGKRSRINLSGKIYPNEIGLDDIKARLGEVNKDVTVKSPWVLMDRDTQGDDNAEHLYRYIKNNHPDRDIYYALRKESKDWDRLSKDGFNLVEFGSSEYDLLLKNSSKIISSHAEKYIHNYLPKNEALQKSFVFLQHGVIKDDLSSWLNSKINLDIFITSTYPEYQSIASTKSSYIFTDREVKLTGLPRHDKLWELPNHYQSSEKIILVMPTWRNSIVGSLITGTTNRLRNPDFEKSDFYLYWKSFLHSRVLLNMVEEYGFKVIFAPHKNIEMYINSFELPSYINVWDSNSHESMQDLFIRSSFLITDYSSVAFEMAYINKSTIYYQFDEEEIYQGSHTYQKGYFDYSEDGFGPKVNTEQELLLELEKILKNEGKIENKYLERIQNTFAYQDANNCKRVYEAICDLDNPIRPQELNIKILFDFAKKSVEHNDIPTAISRCEKLFELGDESQRDWAYRQLLRLYYDDHKFLKLESLLGLYSDLDDSKRVQARLLMLKNDYTQAVDVLNSISCKNITDYFNLFQIAVEDKDIEKAYLYDSFIKKCPEYNIEYEEIISLYFYYLNNDLERLVLRSKYILPSVSRDLVIQYKLELLMAKIYRQLGNYTEAHNSLVTYESHTKDDHECRVEIARLAFEEKKYAKVISQLQKAFDDMLEYMPFNLVYIYIKSAILHEAYELSTLLINKAKNIYGEDDYLLKKLELEFYIQLKNWEKISSFDQFIYDHNLQEYFYYLLISYFKKGNYEKAYNIGVQIKNKELLSDINYLNIMSDLAILMHDWVLAENLLTQSLIFNENNVGTWNKILHVQKMRGD